MQKVSRTMLAVVAAIQSGAHTRRKPKYIKEQALVSLLYPLISAQELSVSTNLVGGGKFLGAVKFSSVNHKNSNIAIEANLRRTLFNFFMKDPVDAAEYSASAYLEISHSGSRDVDIDTREIGVETANYTATADISLSHYAVTYVSIEIPDTDAVIYNASASITVKVT